MMGVTRVAVAAACLLTVLFDASTGDVQAEEDSHPDIKIGGYVKVDFIQDFDPIGNTSQWKVNSIPVDGTPAAGQSGNTNIQARETRLTLTLLEDTPRGKLKAYVEGDFFGDNNTFRIRHAYGEYGQFLGGQTWTTFMDISSRPRSLDYEGPDAEIFVRQAMIRWTRPINENLTFAVAVEQPGGQFAIPDTLAGSARSNVPDVPAHLRYEGERGHVQLAGIARQIRFDGETGSPEVTTTGYGGNLSFLLKTTGKDAFMGEVAFGKGIGKYIESFNGLNADAIFTGYGNMQALDASAGVIAYEHHWNETLMSSLAFATAMLDDDSRLAPSMIKETKDARFNVIWAAYRKVDIGGEMLWGERKNQDGATGEAWRLQFSMIYKLI